MAKARKQQKGRNKGPRLRPPDLVRWALWGMIGSAVLGVALSLYATSLTFTIMQEGVLGTSSCSINSWINCDVAHASSYALMLGVPVSWWGFLFYAWAALAAGVALFGTNKQTAAAIVASTIPLGVGAVLFSLFKAFHLFQLGVLCLVCLGMYIASIGIFLFAVMALGISFGGLGTFLSNYTKSLFGPLTGLTFSPQGKRYVFAIGALFVLGFVGIKNYQDNNVPQAEIDMDRSLSQHFRQQPVTIDVDPRTPVWGNPEAEVTLIEFGDFQCPACQEAAFILRSALYEYRDQVRMYYLQYPLDTSINTYMQRQLHAQAGVSARASLCAADQGDFWEYHDDLFRNQRVLSRQLTLDLAEERGWDLTAFEGCMEDDETRARVVYDIEQGQAAKITSTPTLFVDGRKVAYSRTAEYVRAVVEETLERK